MQTVCENKNYEIYDFCLYQNIISKNRSGQARFLPPASQQTTKIMKIIIFVPVQNKQEKRCEQKL